ncbi:16S rRNA (cytosine(1402)-N(4))-methyltransferase RsmH [Actinomyces sp. zg-332]|uniref:16S rRNA (cytosine(1402)-N(4))-methyltransferase RsmH n=1 Tax=Actinomyces sp. zg-332 TaxID=2708340 RepID=UPI0014217079|nr:16S rRNA (cytosine(1402)-N(4))-methyltransferase RsmH [Actinomyces sp. zg-332]QPK94419.1 16S rRNA (cytosine(1402)-N(4))-methyltransferase RsmH [Actinomyces sp. zg-332]
MTSTFNADSIDLADNQINQIHKPVLLNECLDFLAPAFENTDVAYMIDATLGMGGHTLAALERFPNLHVIGIDRDEQAIQIATKRTEKYADRFTAVHTTYDNVDHVVRQYCPAGKVNAILMDLGVSSLQLDQDDRGFSYARDVELDMRMDKTSDLDAKKIIQTYSAEELAKILYIYGEEKFSRRIANEIVEERGKKPILTSSHLNEVIRKALPAVAKRSGKNPCKKTFQALRIEVNRELEILKKALPNALSSLAVDGIIAIESYHSLEDRMVKTIFNQGSTSTAPIDIPVIPEDDKPYLKLLTRKAIKANEEEVESNSRSQSVRLRVAKKIRPKDNVVWRLK